MKQVILEAQKRTVKKKTGVRHSRKQGLIPAVIYGRKMDPYPIFIPFPTLDKALHQGAAHQILSLKIDADGATEEKLCIIQEIQKDGLGSRVVHVDFKNISMDEKLTAKVPLEFTGNAPGVKEGGILDHVLWEIEVRALPLHFPEKLAADISALAINQSLHVRDIVVPDGVEVLQDPAEVVAVVHPPRVEEVAAAAAPVEGAAPATAAAPAAPAQPEVISKGKKEEEGLPEKPAKK